MRHSAAMRWPPRSILVVVMAASLCACGSRSPREADAGSKGAINAAPVTRVPLPSPQPQSRAQPSAAPLAAIVVPPDALYVCVVDNHGERRQTAIEYAPKVADLCRRHPEMGPCQFEREACRRSGGRVYAAGGNEITRAIEADYDRKVLRVRFPSN